MASSDAATVERALRLVSIELHAVALQRRRLASSEPEDEDFDFRWWTDLQFFILALSRVRRYAELNVPSARAQMRKALAQFDGAVPDLRVMRNIGEHGDEYAVESSSRHMKSIDARQLEVGAWDGQTYQWLGRRLNVDEALPAGQALVEAVKAQSHGIAT
jgi:hypothetical protein